MANFIRYLGLVVATMAAAVQIARAESSTEISVAFTVFAPSTIRGVFYRPTEKKPATALVFSGQARSPTYRYQGSKTIRFYDAENHPVAHADVPNGIARALLLFVPTEAAGGEIYAVVVLNDDLSALPAGHAAFLNCSGARYSASFGERQLVVSEGASGPFDATAQLKIRLTGTFHDEEFVAGVRELKLTANERAWIVLFPPAAAGQIRPQLRFIYDRANTSVVRQK